ncbi:MAG: alcohol dehydrogenase catalytic domain-containing protein, partial [Oligoflexia bacterium]|nr:alcohol dehydrogenase catalytic domain-containing protein [Oligoflexia bacterium]
MNTPVYMDAAVVKNSNNVQIEKIPVPVPGPEEVLIKVESCALCSTDLSLINQPGPGQPEFGSFIPGHEYSGTITAKGEYVDEVEIGDHVAVEVHKGCGRCINCKNGYYTCCLNWGNKKKGHRANGMTTYGGFAQYAVNHISTVYKIPEEVSFDEASLLTNAGCVLYGFEISGGYFVGDQVAVIGDGPLGLISLQIAKTLGADNVCLIGLDDFKMDIARNLGADTVIDVKKSDPVSLLKPAFNLGVDFAIEASGSEAGIRTALKIPKWAGKVLLLGIPAGEITADLKEFARGNKHLFTV